MKEEEKITIDEAIKNLTPHLSQKEQEKQIQALKGLLMEGKTLKESFNIGKDILEFMYSEGSRLYRLHKYEAASKYFHLLYLLDGKDTRYVLGIAACYHMLKNYPLATFWYLVLAVLDLKTPLAFYHLSDCYIQQGEKKAGCYLLKKVIERIGKNPAYAQLKERTTLMIGQLEKEIMEVETKAAI